MIGSLFSGYGGLDLAAEALGLGPVAWHCENEPAPAKVLAAHWPDVPNLGDITAVDWSSVEPADVLVGGFPCQDISDAGKRAGINGARSGLWRHYADAVRVLRPRHALIENVPGLFTRGFDRVLADLSALGYDATWGSVRASEAGACHRRERIFILATDASGGESERRRGLGQLGSTPVGDQGTAQQQQRLRDTAGDSGPTVADTPGLLGTERRRSGPAQAERRRSLSEHQGRDGALTTDPESDRRNEGRAESARVIRGSDAAVGGAARTPVADAVRDRRDRDAQLDGAPKRQLDGERRRHTDGRSDGVAWGPYSSAIRCWESVLGRPAPRPTEPGARGGERLSPRFVEWMQGLPEGWVSDVPGITRNAQLKMLGNGVVPQQAILAFGLLADMAVAA